MAIFLDKKKVSQVRAFLCDVPKDMTVNSLLDKLKKKAFTNQKLGHGQFETGFSNTQSILHPELTEGNAIVDCTVVGSLTRSSAKIPARILNSLLYERYQAYKEENAVVKVPNKLKRQMKADVLISAADKAIQSYKSTPFVFDMQSAQTGGVLYVGASTDKQALDVTDAFTEATGIAPVPISPLTYIDTTDMAGWTGPGTAGGVFLLWLLWKAKEQNWELSVPKRMSFVSTTSTSDAKQVTIKDGDLLNDKIVNTLLDSEREPSSMSLVLVDQTAFITTLTSDFGCSDFKYPDEQTDYTSRLVYLKKWFNWLIERIDDFKKDIKDPATVGKLTGFKHIHEKP